MGALRQLFAGALLVVAPYLAPYVAGWVLYAASAAVSAYDRKREQFKANRAAREAYNASLRDRLQMVDVTADAPRTLALGRVRCVEGIRRRWASGANSELLTIVVSFAGHEIDAFEAFYFDDVELTLDGSGYVTTEPYAKSRRETGRMIDTLDGSGEASFVLSSPPIGGTVRGVWVSGSGPDMQQGDLSVSVSGTDVDVSGGPSGALAEVLWEYTAVTYTARIRTYLGTATQSVGGDLAAEYPGKITATDHFRGIALAVVDLTFDPDVYPQGLPSVTARIRGAKVYDPRLDSTNGGSGSQRLATPSTWAWSENPALLAYHYARHANGWAVPAAEIRTADIVAAANACDVSTDYELVMPDTSTDTVTLARYVCGIVIPTDASPRESMDEIVEAMAGRWGWAGGTLRLRAGALASTAFTMTADWIAQQINADGEPDQGAVVRITNGVTRENRVNRVTGRCVDSTERYQVLPFPAVEDSVLIAAHGEYATEVEFQGVRHIAQAQQLAKILVRQSQAGLRMEAQCNLSAYRCELFDVGAVTVARYGFSGKLFEVAGWRWHPTEGVTLRLAEITADIFGLEALTGRDPAPNSSLPAPWDVEQLTGLAVDSNTAVVSDGAIVSRAEVTWTACTQQSVLSGGQVELQYMAVGGGDGWQSWPEHGSATRAVIPGLLGGRNYMFRGRFVQGLPLVRGPWSVAVLHQVGSTRAPLAWYQNDAPSSPIAGDVWVDTNDGNRLYVYSGSSWENARDTTIAAAQSTANGKVVTFVQASAPTALAAGDLWFDSDAGNKLYRWDGDSWEPYAFGTSALEEYAATEIVFHEGDEGGAGFGTYDVTTFNVTPQVDCWIEFSGKVIADNCVGDSGFHIAWRVTPSGGGTTTLGGSNSNTTARTEYSALSALQVTGGVELTFALHTTRPGTTPAIHVWAWQARVAFVKR